jgi:hypothetical protein
MSANTQNTAIKAKPDYLSENNDKSNPALSLMPSSSPEPLSRMAFTIELKRRGVDVCGSTEQFYNALNSRGGVWCSAEGTDGNFDYHAWEHDPKEEVYVMGVKKELAEWAESVGWYFEFYDAGTVMAWEV